jgi:hypothetical protein
MPTVELLSPAEIEGRRRDLLRRAGMPEDELRRRARDYMLTREQVGILSELEDLDYLLSA